MSYLMRRYGTYSHLIFYMLFRFAVLFCNMSGFAVLCGIMFWVIYSLAYMALIRVRGRALPQKMCSRCGLEFRELCKEKKRCSAGDGCSNSSPRKLTELRGLNEIFVIMTTSLEEWFVLGDSVLLAPVS